MANIYDIDYGTLAGAQGGGQNLQNLVQSLFGTLFEYGSFGTDEEISGEVSGLQPNPSEQNVSLADLGLGQWTNPEAAIWGGAGGGYNLENLLLPIFLNIRQKKRTLPKMTAP